jgi:hypothetical protein
MQLPAPSPAVIFRAVDEGAVLLSTGDEVYYGLNAVGSYIWEQLPPALTTLDDLIRALGRRYPDVPVDRLRADTQALLDDLLAHGLVSHADQAAASAPARLG